MTIDRDKAGTWSKERIVQELWDLRRAIDEGREEITQIESEMDAIESGEDPRSRSDHKDEKISTLNDSANRARERIYETESEIEFLKSLL